MQKAAVRTFQDSVRSQRLFGGIAGQTPPHTAKEGCGGECTNKRTTPSGCARFGGLGHQSIPGGGSRWRGVSESGYVRGPTCQEKAGEDMRWSRPKLWETILDSGEQRFERSFGPVTTFARPANVPSGLFTVWRPVTHYQTWIIYTMSTQVKDFRRRRVTTPSASSARVQVPIPTQTRTPQLHRLPHLSQVWI